MDPLPRSGSTSYEPQSIIFSIMRAVDIHALQVCFCSFRRLLTIHQTDRIVLDIMLLHFVAIASITRRINAHSMP